jgi:hypothetical protein
VVREEGLLGLWSGAGPTMVRNGTNQVSGEVGSPGSLMLATEAGTLAVQLVQLGKAQTAGRRDWSQPGLAWGPRPRTC